MGMTITEKILAAHAGRNSVSPGQIVWVDVDLLMTHDICGPGAIGIFAEQFGPEAKVFDPDRIVIMPDHFIFTAEPKAHRNVEILRDFAATQGIRHYYDPDFMVPGRPGVPAPYADPAATSYRGVCHVGLPQCGHTRPGELLLGTDSHTCTRGAFGEFATGIGSTGGAFVMGTGKLWLKVPETMKFVFHGVMPTYLMAKDLILHIIGEIGVDGATYQAMEFAGEAIEAMGVEERCTICNMAVEAGAKSGIIAPNAETLDYVTARTDRPFEGRAGEVYPSLGDPLTSQHVLLELIEDVVHLLNGDVLQSGDGLGDLLDLIVGEVFHHLAGGFFAQSDHDDGHLLFQRNFILYFFFLTLCIGSFAWHDQPPKEASLSMARDNHWNGFLR